MKTIFFKIFIPICILIYVIVSFTSCNNKTEMEATIFVKLRNDTTIVVPFAKVTMSKADLEVVGYTDYNGRFVHTFSNQVMLDVLAEKDTSENGSAPTLYGSTIIRLGDPGEDVRKTVFIN